MARLLDYQFDNFSTDANGNRIIVNAGTLGSANDAIMHTGQFLDADGVDNWIQLPQTIVSNTKFGEGEFTIRMTVKWLSDSNNEMFLNLAPRDIQFSGYFSPDYPVRIGNLDFWTTEGVGIILMDSKPLAGEIYTFHAVVSKTQGTVKTYVNGQVSYTYTYQDYLPSYNATYCSIFSKATPTSYANVGMSNVWVAYYGLTDAQVQSDYENPEEFLYIDGGILKTKDTNFDPSTVAFWFPFTEGTGNTVYDLANNTSYSLQNFPTDDTQWTNDNEQSAPIQKELFKKDVNGNPASPADPNTVRFD